VLAMHLKGIGDSFGHVGALAHGATMVLIILLDK